MHSRRPESRDAFAARLASDLGKPVRATNDWESCVRDADIVVEASRLPEPQPMLRTAWIKRSAFVVPYGTMSAVELSLTDIMDKLVVDDWGQCRTGQFGALRAHVDAGKLSEKTLHAELGESLRGKPGREADDDDPSASRLRRVRHRARRRNVTRPCACVGQTLPSMTVDTAPRSARGECADVRGRRASRRWSRPFA